MSSDPHHDNSVTWSDTATEDPARPPQSTTAGPPSNGEKKSSSFWLSFSALIVCTFVSALDQTAIATALPTITGDLQGGDDFVWVGAAYGLASAAILPLSGRFADAFGRRPVMLAVVALFLVGSAISGSSRTMNMLIAGRTVQGIGGGGILNLSEIIISDLIPLAERGTYMGLFSCTWALASAVGPPIGGVLAQAGAWRWIFYLNLPLIGLAFALVLVFLRVRTPPGTVKSKLSRLDVFGNLIIVAGTTLSMIGLTWGGVRYPWNAAHVLGTLIPGFTLIAIFFAYEWKVPKEASIPWQVVNNRTTVSAILGALFQGVTSCAYFYYLPVYFQACKGASPLRSSVDYLPTALVIAPFAFAAGTLIQAFQKYRWANVVAWVLSLIGFGLLSTLDADTSTGKWVVYQIITCGQGMLYSATVFPLLAPLPVTRTASALAFFSFTRAFAQSWGITIGSTILQNRLTHTLPAAFAQRFPAGVQIAYAAIPAIGALDEPLRGEVRAAFAASLRVVWQTLVGISALGFLSVGLMREVPMVSHTDATYGLSDDQQRTRAGSDAEKVAAGTAVVAPDRESNEGTQS